MVYNLCLKSLGNVYNFCIIKFNMSLYIYIYDFSYMYVYVINPSFPESLICKACVHTSLTLCFQRLKCVRLVMRRS